MMALLVVLSIIGSVATLAGLYILGVFISQYVVAVTKMFRENVSEIIEKSRAKKEAKKDKEKKTEEIKKETESNEIKIEVSNVIDEISGVK